MCLIPDYIPIRAPRSPGTAIDFPTTSSSRELVPRSPGGTLTRSQPTQNTAAPSSSNALEPLYAGYPLASNHSGSSKRLKPVSFEMLDRPATPVMTGEAPKSNAHEDNDGPPRPPLPNSYSNPGRCVVMVLCSWLPPRYLLFFRGRYGRLLSIAGGYRSLSVNRLTDCSGLAYWWNNLYVTIYYCQSTIRFL